MMSRRKFQEHLDKNMPHGRLAHLSSIYLDHKFLCSLKMIQCGCPMPCHMFGLFLKPGGQGG